MMSAFLEIYIMEKAGNLQPNNKTVWHLESVFEVIPILGPKAGPSTFIVSVFYFGLPD